MNEIEKARLEYFVAATGFARSQLPELDRLMVAVDLLSTANSVEIRDNEIKHLATIYRRDGLVAMLKFLGLHDDAEHLRDELKKFGSIQGDSGWCDGKNEA